MTSFRPATSPDHRGRVVADEDPQHQEGEGDPDQGKAEGHGHQGGDGGQNMICCSMLNLTNMFESYSPERKDGAHCIKVLEKVRIMLSW